MLHRDEYANYINEWWQQRWLRSMLHVAYYCDCVAHAMVVHAAIVAVSSHQSGSDCACDGERWCSSKLVTKCKMQIEPHEQQRS